MKILIDIGHPAHIHYFKNLIKILCAKGAKFKIVARDREHVFTLLRSIQLDYVNRGRGFSGAFSKLLYLPYGVYLIYREAVKFKADFFRLWFYVCSNRL